MTKGQDEKSDLAQARARQRDIWVMGSAGRLHVVEIPAATTPSAPSDSGVEAVLFVHGFAGDASYWSEQLPHVAAQDRRVLALELRGHGTSAPPADDDYAIASMARDIVAAANELKLGRFVMVGHSMGAAVASDYAGSHPDRVSALVLAEPAGDNPKLPREFIEPYRKELTTDNYREAVQRFTTSMLLSNARPAVRERVLEGLRRAPRGLVVNATLASINYSVLPALARYRAAGGRAVTITADANQGPLTLHTLVPDLPRRHMAGTSHFLAMDDPAPFNRLLDEALTGGIWPR